METGLTPPFTKGHLWRAISASKLSQTWLKLSLDFIWARFSLCFVLSFPPKMLTLKAWSSKLSTCQCPPQSRFLANPSARLLWIPGSFQLSPHFSVCLYFKAQNIIYILYSLIHQWTFRLCPCLTYCEHRCKEHDSAQTSLWDPDVTSFG